MKGFGRVITAMATPFTPEGEVDYEQAEVLARFLVKNGSDGLVVAGTTGESPVLSGEEKLTLFRKVKEAVGDSVAVIAGTGSNNTAASVKLTEAAGQTGVDGILLVTPYYNKPSQEGIYQHFKTIAEATSLPVIVYNIPGRTAINIQVPTIVRLAGVDNIVAVKEACGSLDQAAEIRRQTPDDFLIYSGEDALTLPLLSVGAYGVISVASHVAGVMIHQMIDDYCAGKVVEARELHLKLYPLYKALFCTTNPIPLKAALNLMGIKVGKPRLPLTEAAPDQVALVKKVMQDLEIPLA